MGTALAGVTTAQVNAAIAAAVAAYLPLSGGTVSGVLTAAGGLDVSTAGKGLAVAEGSNAKQGTAVLSGGTAVVATTAITAVSRVFVSVQSLGTVSVPSGYGLSARTPGTSFTILSSVVTDTSVVAWQIFEPG